MIGAAAVAAVWRLLIALREELAARARPHASLPAEALARGLVKALARLVAAGAPAFRATVLLLLGGRAGRDRRGVSGGERRRRGRCGGRGGRGGRGERRRLKGRGAALFAAALAQRLRALALGDALGLAPVVVGRERDAHAARIRRGGGGGSGRGSIPRGSDGRGSFGVACPVGGLPLGGGRRSLGGRLGGLGCSHALHAAPGRLELLVAGLEPGLATSCVLAKVPWYPPAHLVDVRGVLARAPLLWFVADPIHGRFGFPIVRMGAMVIRATHKGPRTERHPGSSSAAHRADIHAGVGRGLFGLSTVRCARSDHGQRRLLLLPL